MNNKRLNNLFIDYIKMNLNKTDEEVEKIQYGIYVLTLNLFKTIIIFVTAYLFNIVTYTLVGFITFGILRSFASGVHADSTIKCICYNYIIFLGSVFLAFNISLNSFFMTIIFLISLILIVKYILMEN